MAGYVVGDIAFEWWWRRLETLVVGYAVDGFYHFPLAHQFCFSLVYLFLPAFLVFLFVLQSLIFHLFSPSFVATLRIEASAGQ